jgi:hypothetical protein
VSDERFRLVDIVIGLWALTDEYDRADTDSAYRLPVQALLGRAVAVSRIGVVVMEYIFSSFFGSVPSRYQSMCWCVDVLCRTSGSS